MPLQSGLPVQAAVRVKHRILVTVPIAAALGAVVLLGLTQSAPPIVGPQPIGAEPSHASTAPLPTPTATAAPGPTATSAPTSTPSPTAAPIPTVLFEANTGAGSEPAVAISPFDAQVAAVTHQHVDNGCDQTGVRMSMDGGRTWREVAREPWRGYCPDYHGQVAWGPRPGGGSRLWWVDAIAVGPGQLAVGITYSDDLGASWAPLHINRATPPWVGGFPDITVDTDGASPRFGTVWVAYNWLESARGPGVGILASRDDGRTWQVAQVPAVGLAGYPYHWRIGYRIKAAPDGSAFVSFYESDLRSWSASDIFAQGSATNIGRMGFATARLRYAGSDLVADPAIWAISVAKDRTWPFDPQWQTGLDVDAGGRLWMAVGDRPGTGTIHVGYSDDGGRTFTWRALTVPGSSSYKPSLALEGDVVFVGWHAFDRSGLVHTYFTVSYDRGSTYLAPRTVDKASWPFPGTINGTGLRESADFVAGRILYAWGDNRRGLSVYVAVIKP
jgi:hypothetical protein